MESRKRKNTRGSPPRDYPPSIKEGSPPLVKAPTSTVVFVYQDRRILVPRPRAFEIALWFVNKYISSDATNVRFLARVPHVEDEVEITPDAWALVADGIVSFRVEVTSKRSSDVIYPGSSSLLGPIPSTSQEASFRRQLPQLPAGKIIQILVKTLTGKTIPLNVNPDDTITAVKARLEETEGIPPEQMLLIYTGLQLQDECTVAHYLIQHLSTITLVIRLQGGKPVIYLYPPSSMDVQVGLALVPEWRFSTIYPMVPIYSFKSPTTPFIAQRVTWDVHAQQDGTLADKLTGSKLSYLFWEAETHVISPASPPNSRPSTPGQGTSNEQYLEEFIPGKSACYPHNSALLQVQAVPYYLDQALLALGLHTEARTSFITYWLPSILKHPYIALRFVPQASYERAATLNITPAPDLMTRVFMLFQGVQSADVHTWTEAEERAKQPVSIWKSVVGIQEERQKDATLFRVLEWGGMEVV